ncbi:MAG: carbohydrate kinase family protein [bacterium]
MKKKKVIYDIITAGSATIDIFVDTANKLFCERVPFGEKILIDKLHLDIGGGAINTGIAFTRLGLKTGVLAKVGPEFVAPKEIDDSLIIRDKNAFTDHSIILDATGKDRTILVYKDASIKLDFSEIRLPETKWIYLSSMPLDFLEKIADLNVKFALNTRQAPKRLLEKTDILILNKEEAEALGDDIKKPKICVITDKNNPVKAFSQGVIHSITPHKNIKCLERTGAGDAFASGFTAGIILKNNIDFALKLGLANSESVIQHYGAHNKLLTYDEACKLIKS